LTKDVLGKRNALRRSRLRAGARRRGKAADVYAEVETVIAEWHFINAEFRMQNADTV
jgi:hypothetical protein